MLIGKDKPACQLKQFIDSKVLSSCVVVGEPECGKTFLVNTVLPHALYIDAREMASVKVLLKRLSKAFCSSINHLVDLQTAVLIQEMSLIVVDHFECIERNLDDGHRIISILSRLPEKHKCQVVLVGRDASFFLDSSPLIISVPCLDKDEIIQISSQRLGDSTGLDVLAPLFMSVQRANGSVHPEGFTTALAQLYPLFVRPIEEGSCVLSNSLALFKELRPKMIELLNKGSLIADALESKLCAIGQCLLIASHLCRMNSIKHELMIFGEECGKKKRKAPSSSSSSASQSNTLFRNKATPIQRILAVFYHIYPHHPPTLCRTLSVLRSLFDRKLILPIAQYDRSDNFKVRCNINYGQVVKLEMSMGIKVSKYIP